MVNAVGQRVDQLAARGEGGVLVAPRQRRLRQQQRAAAGEGDLADAGRRLRIGVIAVAELEVAEADGPPAGEVLLRGLAVDLRLLAQFRRQVVEAQHRLELELGPRKVAQREVGPPHLEPHADEVRLHRQDALVDEARLAGLPAFQRGAGEQVVELQVARQPVLVRLEQLVGLGIAAGAHKGFPLRRRSARQTAPRQRRNRPGNRDQQCTPE